MKNSVLITLIASLLAIGVACEQKAENNKPESAAQTVAASESNEAENEEVQDAKVTLVKFSDYQCPGCKYYVAFEHQLKEDFGDDIRIISKHFPLTSHPYAAVAARAAEAARVQGKYEEMHDMLFAGQAQWSRGNAEAIFVGYADALDLDVEKFESDMQSAEMNRRVMADRREGRELGVNSTPTYFINGEKVNHPSTYPAFKEMVEQYMD